MKPGRPPKTRLVPLDDIIFLPKTMRPRVKEDADQIAQYATDMQAGASFPPITLFKGVAGELAGLGLTRHGTIAEITATQTVLVAADGTHRVGAAGTIKRTEILSTVESGTWRDAQWFAFGSNHTHGLHVTSADKRKIVGLILDDKEWSRRSARAIADHCHVSPNLVDVMKKERAAAATALRGQSDKAKVVIDRRGRAMKTAKIGKSQDGRPRQATIDTLIAPAPIDTLILPAPVTDVRPVTIKGLVIKPAPAARTTEAVNLDDLIEAMRPPDNETPAGLTTSPRGWSRAAIALQTLSEHKSIQTGLRTTLQHAREWEIAYPKYREALAEFFYALSQAFNDAKGGAR